MVYTEWWALHHMRCRLTSLIIKLEDTLIIYRDMTCKTGYCSKNPTYDVYKSFDANQNCRVRILPDCTLSDM